LRPLKKKVSWAIIRERGRFGRRFPLLCEVLRELPARSAIIDGEIVASDAAGMPNFWPLFLRSAKPAELHIWTFDLLALNGKDLRKWSLEARQGRLQGLVSRLGCPALLASEPFKDGQALLEVAERHGLEGVASNRRLAPYRSGECRDWRKRRPRGARRTGSEASFRAGLSAGLPPSCCRPVRSGLP
jgi:ATP-dependent DNA ligase